jgi:hypothetical protein
MIVLAAAVASASGGWHPALWFAVLIGGGIVASLLMTLRAEGNEAATG